jgi:hypothetical protein
MQRDHKHGNTNIYSPSPGKTVVDPTIRIHRGCWARGKKVKGEIIIIVLLLWLWLKLVPASKPKTKDKDKIFRVGAGRIQMQEQDAICNNATDLVPSA